MSCCAPEKRSGWNSLFELRASQMVELLFIVIIVRAEE